MGSGACRADFSRPLSRRTISNGGGISTAPKMAAKEIAPHIPRLVGSGTARIVKGRQPGNKIVAPSTSSIYADTDFHFSLSHGARSMTRLPVFCAILFVSLSERSLADIVLNFDSPVPGTVADKTGFGTGFMDRLPGTGGSLPFNDPNLDLTAIPGHLVLTSTRADFNFQRNLDFLEAPAVFVPGIGTNEFEVSALLRDVTVPNGSDQLFVFAGAASDKTVRAGFHETNVYFLIENHPGTGATDNHLFVTGASAFATGDDVILSLARSSGLWSLSWDNLSNPTASSATPGFSIPWLDAEPDLYFGIHAANAGSFTPFNAVIDSFSVNVAATNVVPEPSSFLLWTIGMIPLASGLLRRRPCSPLV
jgi:hypothetical protein